MESSCIKPGQSPWEDTVTPTVGGEAELAGEGLEARSPGVPEAGRAGQLGADATDPPAFPSPDLPVSRVTQVW